MIDKYLNRGNDTFNLKTINKKECDNDKIYTNYKKFKFPEEFGIFLEKFKINPDPFIHINSYYNFKEQLFRNALLSPKRYELFYRKIYDGFTEIRISFVLIYDNGIHYKIIKNFFHEMRIDLKHTAEFEDAIILFFEKNKFD